MTIVPDTKDWTWVVHRTRPECGFDAQSFPREEIPAILLADAAGWGPVLAGPGEARDRAPGPLVAAGVRVPRAGRVPHLPAPAAAHAHPRQPSFPNWDQDATAVAERYGEQDPGVVSGELVAAAGG